MLGYAVKCFLPIDFKWKQFENQCPRETLAQVYQEICTRMVTVPTFYNSKNFNQHNIHWKKNGDINYDILNTEYSRENECIHQICNRPLIKCWANIKEKSEENYTQDSALRLNSKFCKTKWIRFLKYTYICGKTIEKNVEIKYNNFRYFYIQVGVGVSDY